MTAEPIQIPAASTTRWRALFLLLLVFVIGAACGVGGGALVLRAVMQRVLHGELRDGNAPVDWVIGSLERDLGNDLRLTPEEKAAVHQELLITAGQFQQMRLQVAQDARERVRETLDRVGKHLPEEKRKVLQERTARRLRPWGLMPLEPARR